MGEARGYGGTKLFPVRFNGTGVGEPDSWAYCIEHDVSAITDTPGTISPSDDFLGGNYFNDPVVQGKVFWLMANSYPVLSLDQLAAQVGLPSISENDAIEATTYAIWRFTDVGFDADWYWETTDSEAAYKWLVNAAKLADTSAPSSPTPVTATINPPIGSFTAGNLVGPFIVSTSEATVQVTSDQGFPLVDSIGDLINTSEVTDGQQLFLDTSGATANGGASVTVTATGAQLTNKIISVPTTSNGTPSVDRHAQTIALVTPFPENAVATAEASWAAVPVPAIRTMLLDATDNDQVIHWRGGTAIDTIAYEILTPGVEYTVAGELVNKANGEGTGITGQNTFTPVEANGAVQVTFIIPEGHASQTFVAFERLYLGADTSGTPVATHEDIHDAAQTVTVESAPAEATVTPQLNNSSKSNAKLATTGGEAPLGMAVLGLLTVTAGAVLVLRRRRVS